MTATGCTAVLVDIAPMGIAVAQRAGLPSVLVENFDWPGLYEPFFSEASGLSRHAGTLATLRTQATLTVQTEPVCFRDERHPLVSPISRPARRSREETREAFGVPAGDRLVVVTMGGYGEAMPFLDDLRAESGITFVVTGAERTGARDNLRLVSNQTPVFMPDLMQGADAVVAKLGYGTVAEAWCSGVPLGFVSRPGFPEMRALEAFVGRALAAREVELDDFASGAWIAALPELLDLPRRPHEGNGADEVAELFLAIPEGR